MNKKNSVVILSGTCSSPDLDQKSMNYDVGWSSILHHSLAEVARREHDCDNPSYRDMDVKDLVRECNSILRQSVP